MNIFITIHCRWLKPTVIIISCFTLFSFQIILAQTTKTGIPPASRDTIRKSVVPHQPKPRQPKSKEIPIIAKNDAATTRAAMDAFTKGNYAVALPNYLSLQKAKPQNTEYNYRAGICYLFTNVDKSKAIPLLEFAAKQKEAEKDVYYYLGRAYHLANRFDEAISCYEKYRETGKKTRTLVRSDVGRQIAMCKSGKELIMHPVNVTFESLGKSINTPYPDYNPFITADESMLVFSSRRKGTTGNTVDESDNLANADVFVSYKKEGGFSKAKSISNIINTEYDEEALGLSADGQKLLLYIDNLETPGAICISTAKGKGWLKPVPLNETINSEAIVTGASLSPDGQILYFSSDMKGGYGGKDIYFAHLLPDGTWSPAESLEEPINTEYDEDAPYMSLDGHTLYFCSKGHNSMGGYDIFKTVLNDSTKAWSEPENIGYPINTADDNLYFSLSGQGKYAYISALRPEGFGDLDIYKVNFKEVMHNNYQTIIRGNLLRTDSTIINSATITCTNKENNNLMGTYLPNISSGVFVIPLLPGTYNISIESNGFAAYQEDITIPEIKQPYYIDKKIILKK